MRVTKVATLVAVVVSLSVVPAAAQTGGDARIGATASIRIGLPENPAPIVSVTPGEGHVVVVLPIEADLPADLESASGGLLRGAEVMPLDDGRQRVDLLLARGLLDEVRFEPGAVVLRFHSRSLAGSDDGDASGQYRLGADDRILVTVHNHPELSAGLVLSRSGTVTLPHVGEVTALGQTPRQLADRLAELLGRDIVVDPLVDIQVIEYNSQWAMVSGEVQESGKVPLRGGTDLKSVLAEAGGLTIDAGERIVISRRAAGSTTSENIVVDREAFEHGETNPLLQHGDIVTVVRASYCYVRGEVRAPGRHPIERGMTLMKAITLAGGLTDWAKSKNVQVIHPDGDVGGKTYNLEDIERGKVPDPVLTGGEVVIVKRRFF
jgi:polysaccharide export outer membrane protein